MKSNIKKIIALLLALSLLVICMPCVFAADSELTASLNTVSGFPGDSVEMNIELSGNSGLTSLKFEVGFDDSVLTLTDVTFNSAFGSLVSAATPYSNPQTISFISPFEAVNVNGVFATLTFEINENAQPGSVSDVTLGYIPEDIIDGNDDVTDITVKSASVVIDGEAIITPLDDFTYSVKEDDTLIIEGYNGDDAKAVIAEEYEIDGVVHKVSEIAESAFEGNKVITSVIIPASVEKIGDYAFYDCNNLKEATVLGKTTEIGEKSLGYHYVSRKEDGVNEGFVIKGYNNSLAKTYSDSDENISFFEIEEECKHKNAHPGKGKEPTCFVPGLTAGFFCPDCNCWIVAQTEIPPKHNFGKWSVNGTQRTHECLLCKETETENIINNIMTEGDTVIDYENSVIFSNICSVNDLETIVFVPGTVTVRSNSSSAGYFGTGSTVNVYSNKKLVGEFSVVVNGDIDGDSICDVIDIVLTERIVNECDYATRAQMYAANGCVSDEMSIVSYQNVVNRSLNQ